MKGDAVPISTMLKHSADMLTNPSVETFEKYEGEGGLLDAAKYLAVGALITGLLGLGGGISVMISNVISTLFSFFVFTGLVYTVGKGQEGTGQFEEVAYTFSLFWVPIAVGGAVINLALIITIVGILLVPFVTLASLIAAVYFAYIAVKSSMNIQDRGKAAITLIAAFFGTLVVNIIARIF